MSWYIIARIYHCSWGVLSQSKGRHSECRLFQSRRGHYIAWHWGTRGAFMDFLSLTKWIPGQYPEVRFTGKYRLRLIWSLITVQKVLLQMMEKCGSPTIRSLVQGHAQTGPILVKVFAFSNTVHYRNRQQPNVVWNKHPGFDENEVFVVHANVKRVQLRSAVILEQLAVSQLFKKLTSSPSYQAHCSVSWQFENTDHSLRTVTELFSNTQWQRTFGFCHRGGCFLPRWVTELF
jgi:hypothetical protein